MIMTMNKDISAYAQLTGRQKQFVDKYVICFNASQAAREAGYSPASARAIAGENLQKPLIKQAIEEQLKLKGEREGAASPKWIRDTTKKKIEECKNPKDAFIGLDLLAKITPGTLDQPKTAATEINLFAILGKLPQLNQLNPSSNISLNAPFNEPLNTEPLNTPRVNIPLPTSITIDNNVQSSTDGIINSPPTDDTTSPPPPLRYSNKLSDKIAEQKSDDNTCESCEKLMEKPMFGIADEKEESAKDVVFVEEVKEETKVAKEADGKVAQENADVKDAAK